MSDLDRSIERLYEAFADVPRPQSVEGCPCCTDPRLLERLVTERRETQDADLMSQYAFSALTTIGDVNDYLYFLPRILQLSAGERSWPVDPEVTGRAIRETRIDEWPVRRVEALEAVVRGIVRRRLAREDYDEMGEWVFAAARMGLDVTPLLQILEESPGAVLAFFVANSPKIITERKLPGRWWTEAQAAHEDIVDWFYSKSVRRIVFEGCGAVLR